MKFITIAFAYCKKFIYFLLSKACIHAIFSNLPILLILSASIALVALTISIAHNTIKIKNNRLNNDINTKRLVKIDKDGSIMQEITSFQNRTQNINYIDTSIETQLNKIV